jgi:hypothetical protein
MRRRPRRSVAGGLGGGWEATSAEAVPALVQPAIATALIARLHAGAY